MKRSKHSLSHYRLLTADMGKLYPIACYEALPGDTIQQTSALLVRVSPLLAPVMHPVSVRVHHWFVPYRLLWDGFEDFITGGSDGLGNGAVPPTIGATTHLAKSLSDYFGLPVGVPIPAVSALAFRAYTMIFNEHYRDQDLVSERPFITADGLDSTTLTALANIAWEKDQFTNARPWPQKGPDVSMPLGVSAPVVPEAAGAAPQFNLSGQNVYLQAAPSVGLTETNWSAAIANAGVRANWSDTGLIANLSGATAVNVNDVRRAFALQRYQEARAMYGSRFTEYLRYLGVRSSDARLQRPEYLGGGKQTISFSEVLKTGAGEDPAEPIGAMKGHGIAAMRSRRYRRFFEEHGLVMSLLSVRPRTMYNDGIDKMWFRNTKEDYWQKELEHIGQEEVFNKEVYGQHATPDGVFGYQDRYYSYRHIMSKIAGDFRTTLNFWHMARIFGSAPVLNASFVECDPTKRIHAVTSEDVLWVMASHSIQARRLVGRPSIGRIL